MGETYERGQMIETTETLKAETNIPCGLRISLYCTSQQYTPPLCDLQDGLTIYGIRARVKC